MINDKNDSKESGFFESTKNIIKSIKKILKLIMVLPVSLIKMKI